MSRRAFDSFEVSLCQDFPDPTGGTYTERVNDMDEWASAEEERLSAYYTVYGYRSWQPDPEGNPNFMAPDGGAEAIADYKKYEDALDLAYSLADGKHVEVTVPDGLESVNHAVTKVGPIH